MVHDLKMPLSIILGAAQLIEMKLENSGHGMETKDGRGDEIAANGCIRAAGMRMVSISGKISLQ